MDQKNKTFCVALVASFLLSTSGVSGDDVVPSNSGVGGVSLEKEPARSALLEAADRLAARVESASREADVGVDRPVNAGSSEPMLVETDAGSVATGSGIVPKPLTLDDRLRLREGTAASGEPLADTKAVAGGESWWSGPEARVVGLLTLLCGAAFFARRFAGRGVLPGGARPAGVLTVLARYPFGRGASLVLIECGPRIILMHQHGGRGGAVTTVSEFSEGADIAELRTRLGTAERTNEDGFHTDLIRNLGRYDRQGRPEGFGGPEGLPIDEPMETVDLTRRRPRGGVRSA